MHVGRGNSVLFSKTVIMQLGVIKIMMKKTKMVTVMVLKNVSKTYLKVPERHNVTKRNKS